MSEIYTNIYNKKGRAHKSKKVVTGKCKFPFIYKNQEYDECLDTGHGPWCPVTLTSRGRVKTWGYCVGKDVVNAAGILTNLKKSRKKSRKKSKGGGRKRRKSQKSTKRRA